MAKRERFKYNPETLSYEKVEISWGERILKSLLVIAPAIALAFILQFTLSPWIKSPREVKMEKELNTLRAQVKENENNVLVLEQVASDLAKHDDEIYRVVFNAEPFSKEFRDMGTGGVDNDQVYEKLKGYELSDKVISTSQRIKLLEKRLYAQSMSFQEIIELAKEKEKMLASIPAIQPVANKDLTRVASGYGWRIDPIYKTRRMHWGLDFTAPTGSNVYATGNGIVEKVEVKRWGYGQNITINHGYGYKTRYAHLSKFLVKQGDKVVRGQIIGLVGSTGKSTAPHLHYEVEKNGEKTNPVHYFHSDLSPEEYEKMIEMSSNANQTFD